MVILGSQLARLPDVLVERVVVLDAALVFRLQSEGRSRRVAPLHIHAAKLQMRRGGSVQRALEGLCVAVRIVVRLTS